MSDDWRDALDRTRANSIAPAAMKPFVIEVRRSRARKIPAVPAADASPRDPGSKDGPAGKAFDGPVPKGIAASVPVPERPPPRRILPDLLEKIADPVAARIEQSKEVRTSLRRDRKLRNTAAALPDNLAASDRRDEPRNSHATRPKKKLAAEGRETEASTPPPPRIARTIGFGPGAGWKARRLRYLR